MKSLLSKLVQIKAFESVWVKEGTNDMWNDMKFAKSGKLKLATIIIVLQSSCD